MKLRTCTYNYTHLAIPHTHTFESRLGGVVITNITMPLMPLMISIRNFVYFISFLWRMTKFEKMFCWMISSISILLVYTLWATNSTFMAIALFILNWCVFSNPISIILQTLLLICVGVHTKKFETAGIGFCCAEWWSINRIRSAGACAGTKLTIQSPYWSSCEWRPRCLLVLLLVL